jgi:hypothetical protein
MINRSEIDYVLSNIKPVYSINEFIDPSGDATYDIIPTPDCAYFIRFHPYLLNYHPMDIEFRIRKTNLHSRALSRTKKSAGWQPRLIERLNASIDYAIDETNFNRSHGIFGY